MNIPMSLQEKREFRMKVRMYNIMMWMSLILILSAFPLIYFEIIPLNTIPQIILVVMIIAIFTATAIALESMVKLLKKKKKCYLEAISIKRDLANVRRATAFWKAREYFKALDCVNAITDHDLREYIFIYTLQEIINNHPDKHIVEDAERKLYNLYNNKLIKTINKLN